MIGVKLHQAFLAAPVLAMAFAAPSQTFAAPYFQGFETDTSGWVGATRVPSGTNGVPSASGGFHAQVGGGAYTYWGGNNASTNGATGVFQPYTTSVDIYLDMASAGNDVRFDYTSAINNVGGTHLRDFVFNAGFYDSSDVTGPGAGSDRFIVSASNGATRPNSFPKNPGRDPFAITTTGWYTFQHSFFDNAGMLGVTLSILDSANTLIHSWLLGGQDAMATVGGSRYGWFPANEFAFLAIDNTSLDVAADAVPVPAALPLFASGMGMFGLLAWRRKRKSVAAAATA
jgi:hypothetical protein